MATRAMISIAKREEGVSFSEIPERTIVDIYHHWDGYPEGVGVTLASYLEDMEIVNGLGRDDIKVANGLGCLAAQLVQHFKDGPGNIYLEAINGEPGDSWEEYIYTLYPKPGEPTYISIYDVDARECIFVGTYADLQTKYDD